MGSKTTQQGSTASSTTPAGLAQLQSIYSKVADAASQPYNPYTGELTAGVNNQQQTGINNINANANYAQPYIQQAGTLASGASNPLTAAQIQQYQNPYTQNVVNATQAQFNNANGVQQQQVKGNAALAGALGGDRQAVAQAELANQQQLAQAPVIAGLYSNAYNSGLSTATNQFQTNPLAAASSLGNIGVAGQNSALAGAQAQVAGGTLQQQTQQAADTANLGQYNQAQAFPYQQAQYLASIGAPIASAEGSTTNGTTSTQTNPFAQYAGLGIAGAGLFLKDGGAVPHMASGGAPFNFITDSGGYIPQVQALNLKAPTAPAPSTSAASTANPWASATTGLGNMKGIFGGSDTMGSPGVSSPLSMIGGAGDYAVPTFMSHGGLVEAVHAIRNGIDRANGGTVSGYGQPSNGIYIPHMADGGDPATFDQRFGFPFQNTDNSPIIPDPGLQQVSPQAMNAWRSGVDTPNPAIAANDDTAAPPIAPDTPLTRSAGLPPQITGQPDNTTPDESSPALGYNGSPVLNPALTANSSVTPVADTQQPQTFGHSLFGVNLSDKTRQGLVAAGLAMAASKNPSFVGALGEGGLKGLGAYSDATKAEQEAADKKLTQTQNQTRIDMEAKRIAQAAEQFSKTNSLAERKFKADQETGKYIPAGSIMSADGSVHPAVMDKNTGKITDSVTGAPPKEDDKIQPTGKKDPNVVKKIADGIESGRQPPTTTGLYGMGPEIKAELESRGFDLAKSNMQWQQAQKQTASLNAPQMVRFVGLAKSVDSTINEVRDLSKQMENSGVPLFNRAKLATYMQAEGNSENGQLAARYIGAVNTLKEEFANLANGGFAPTEAVWELANKQINGDYGVKQMGASLDEVQRLIRYRVNAVPGLSTMGPGSSNRYTGQTGNQTMPVGDHGASSNAITSPVVPQIPNGIPPGSAYSPSRKQWKTPDGKIFNADGSPAS